MRLVNGGPQHVGEYDEPSQASARRSFAVPFENNWNVRGHEREVRGYRRAGKACVTVKFLILGEVEAEPFGLRTSYSGHFRRRLIFGNVL